MFSNDRVGTTRWNLTDRERARLRAHVYASIQEEGWDNPEDVYDNGVEYDEDDNGSEGWGF
jgi:hypothetical protein